MMDDERGFIRSGTVKFHQSLQPLLADIDSVHQSAENYNNGDIEAVKESVQVNGMYRPVFVQDSSGDIIAGNHTWQACKELGATQIPVVRLNVNDTEAFRIMIADNRTAALAMPDSTQLVSLLTRLASAEDGMGMAGTGYGQGDLTVLEHLAEIPYDTDEFGQWPTISAQVPPHVRRAYMHMTREADSDRDRIELLLRLAGWDGEDHRS